MPLLEGPVAIAFVHGDAVVAAKALRDFGKTNPALVVKGGLLGPRILTAAEFGTLAEIEPREVLLARLAGGFQAPLTKAAGLFQAFTRNFAYGVKAYIDQRVEGGRAPVEAPAARRRDAEHRSTRETEPSRAPKPAPVEGRRQPTTRLHRGARTEPKHPRRNDHGNHDH